MVVAFGALVLLLGATRTWTTGDGGGFVERALPAPPVDAPDGDQYQQFSRDNDEGRFQAQVEDDPQVVVDSIQFVGTSTGPFADAEFYQYKVRFDGGVPDLCFGQFTEFGGSAACGPPGGAGPEIGGGSSQTNNGPVIESLSVTGLDPESRWARVELASGLAIVGDVQQGVAYFEWVQERAILIEVFNDELELLWSDDPSF